MLNGHFVVAPAAEFGSSWLLSHEEAAALGIEAPGDETDQRQLKADEERRKTDEAIRAWAKDHPETRRAERLRAKFGDGPRPNSPEAVFAAEAEKQQAKKAKRGRKR